jgi:hypothetical protein
MNGVEVSPVTPMELEAQTIALQSCTATWPQARDRSHPSSVSPSTPRQSFMLVNLTLNFPQGELSLICGKLGSGKTLLLLGTLHAILCLVYAKYDLALLGEVDTLAGQIICPRSPPDTLASFAGVHVSKENWIVEGISAYVPQVSDPYINRIKLTYESDCMASQCIN